MEFYRANCIQKLRLIRQAHACSALHRQFYAAMVGFPRAYSLTWQAWHVPVITSYELQCGISMFKKLARVVFCNSKVAQNSIDDKRGCSLVRAPASYPSCVVEKLSDNVCDKLLLLGWHSC